MGSRAWEEVRGPLGGTASPSPRNNKIWSPQNHHLPPTPLLSLAVKDGKARGRDGGKKGAKRRGGKGMGKEGGMEEENYWRGNLRTVYNFLGLVTNRVT